MKSHKRNGKATLVSMLALMSLFSLQSCSDFLDQSSSSYPSQKTVFSDVEKAGQALNDVYAKMTVDAVYGDRLPYSFCCNTDIEFNNTKASNFDQGNGNGAGNYYADAGWKELSNSFAGIYEVVASANNVIDGLAASAIANGDDAKAKLARRYSAEAKVIRALCYNELTRLYGDVPARMSSITSDGAFIGLGKSNRDSILDVCLKDLDECADDLPWLGEQTSEHVTANFAHALAARMALQRGGWAIREKDMNTTGYDSEFGGYETDPTADKVYPTQRPAQYERFYTFARKHLEAILASNNNKSQLDPSFEHIWKLINKQQFDDTYYENIFEIAHGLGGSGNIGYSVGQKANAVTTEYGYTNYANSIHLPVMYFWSFDRDDHRRDVTCTSYYIDSKSAADPTAVDKVSGHKSNLMTWNVGKWRYEWMAGNEDWLIQNRSVDGKTAYGINWVILRYSDVLLMYAEVLNEQEGPDAAGVNGQTPKDLVYAVHRRGYQDEDGNVSSTPVYAGSTFTPATRLEHFRTNLYALSTKENMFDAIVDERALEFGGEAIRKWDLVRWNLLRSKIAALRNVYLTEHDDQTYNQNGCYTRKFYYKRNGNQVDKSSFQWFNSPFLVYELSKMGYADADAWAKDHGHEDARRWMEDNFTTAAGYESADGDGNRDNSAVFDWLSSGILNGYNGHVVTVKNRYILPIGTNSLNQELDVLENSYGF